MLDANQIVGGLYVGSYPQPGPAVGRAVDALVLCAKELQPPSQLYPGASVYHCPFNDSSSGLTTDEFKRIQTGAKWVRANLDAGKKVLVTCHMGLNRSALVAALSLMLPSQAAFVYLASTPSCLSASMAIDLIRRARGPEALFNQYFVYLLARSEGICGARRKPFRMQQFIR